MSRPSERRAIESLKDACKSRVYGSAPRSQTHYFANQHYWAHASSARRQAGTVSSKRIAVWCQCMTEGVRSPRPDDWLKNPILLNLSALAASREECRPVGMVTAPAWIVCISGRSGVTDEFPTILLPHHIAPPLINCLLKLLPPSLVSSAGPAGHSACRRW